MKLSDTIYTCQNPSTGYPLIIDEDGVRLDDSYCGSPSQEDLDNVEEYNQMSPAAALYLLKVRGADFD